jgi:hypothetical protein
MKLLLAGNEIICVLEFCQKLLISASGRKDREHQKTAMHTVATIACISSASYTSHINPIAMLFHREKVAEAASQVF